MGFAFLAIPVVLVVVMFTRSLWELPNQILGVIGRGEMMIYAASVCGTALYSLRHGIKGPLPEALKARVTPIGTLTTFTAILLFFAVASYVVRRMGDINQIPINEGLLNTVSVLVLAASLIVTYVVLSLKFALSSGYAPASHEQIEDFRKRWEAERNA